MSRALVVSVMLAVAVLSACGEAVAPTQSGNPPGPDPGAWVTERLEATIGPDQAPLLSVAGRDALILAVSETGTLVSYLSEGGEPFEPGEALETGLDFLALGDAVRLSNGDWLTLGSGGLSGTGSDTTLTFSPVAFRSRDGLAWQAVPLSGIEGPTDIHDLAVIDGTIVMAGSSRTAADPSFGGFQAHLWTSRDGVSFTRVDLPDVEPARGYRNESFVGSLVEVDGRLLAGGRVSNVAAVWASEDAARTWRRVDDETVAGGYSINGLQTVDGLVLAGLSGRSVTAVRSSDGGDTWEPVESLPATGEDAGWAPIWADGRRFWTLAGVDDTSWSRPEICYADVNQCRTNPSPTLLASRDGSEWTSIELPGEVVSIAGTTDGRVLVLDGSSSGVSISSLPSDATPPGASAVAEPETVDLVTVGKGETPQVGVRYHAPFYLHCGMDWLWFGNETWKRTDTGPGVETGAGDSPPATWPVVGQVLYGYATRVSDSRLEYSLEDGEVIATYRRAEGAPGCD